MSCTQYIHGLVDENELETLRSYSSLVTEFILTDVNVKNDKPIIASSTFFSIAQFLEPNSGLLPSLSHLHIIQADYYFPCLHLLHTPSLRTLEANVPDHQHPNFFSFLTTLVHKAPLLEEIILASGQFPLKSLQAILKFTYLRQLELRDVASTIDFTFLQDVGALPNLESFILDARSCNYTARILEELPNKTPPAPVEPTEAGSQTLQPSSEIDGGGLSQDVCLSYLNSEITTELRKFVESWSVIDSDRPSLSLSRPSSPTFGIYKDKEADQPLPSIYNQIPSNKVSSISAMSGFYQLKKFHFVGGLPLLQDMILYITSSSLEDISISVNDLSQDLRQELKAENMRQAAEAEKRKEEFDKKTQLEIDAMEEARRIRNGVVKKASTSSSLRRQEILLKAETQWKEQEAQYQAQYQAQYEKRKKTEGMQKLQKHTPILQTVSFRWSADLKTVRFNNLDGSSQSLPALPILQKLVYGPLLCLPKLEILEFKQWKLDSVEDFLLSMKSSCPENLKQLHLPIDDPGSAISLSGLLDIAEACPMLKSLQCCIDTLPPIPEYSTPTTKALSHGLQSLFVANKPTSTWDFNQLLLVARHLYLAFPRLQTIDSMEGSNAEQWVRILDLIKMFQVIRQDDVKRFY